MAKLKSALIAHQAHSAKKAKLAKAEEARKAKERSIPGLKRSKPGNGVNHERKTQQAPTGRHKVKKGNGETSRSKSQKGSTQTMQHLSGTIARNQAEPSNPGTQSGPSSSAAGGSRTKQRKPTLPFTKNDTILLLGEANFSFSLSLITHHPVQPHQVLATTFDSEDITYTKYPDARRNVESLKERGVRVGFGVDAGNLEGSKVVGKGKRWSKVVFNFPHVGAGIKDQDRNILSNQHLLLRFLRSVSHYLTEGPEDPNLLAGKMNNKRKRQSDDSDDEDDDEANSNGDDVDAFENRDEFDLDHTESIQKTFKSPNVQGSILITLLNQPPYTLWNLPKLSTHPPHLCPGTRLPQPIYKVLRSFKFDPALYPGYEHRRTIGWKKGVSVGDNAEIRDRKGEARTWQLVLSKSKEE